VGEVSSLTRRTRERMFHWRRRERRGEISPAARTGCSCHLAAAPKDSLVLDPAALAFIDTTGRTTGCNDAENYSHRQAEGVGFCMAEATAALFRLLGRRCIGSLGWGEKILSQIPAQHALSWGENERPH
jgi:hypothetical protein